MEFTSITITLNDEFKSFSCDDCDTSKLLNFSEDDEDDDVVDSKKYRHNNFNQYFVKEKSKYKLNGNEIKFNDKTQKYYMNIRKLHMDPITMNIVHDNIAFKFYDQWDPYTGERANHDPYGPLYFDPVSIARYFYTKRYYHLWIPPSDEADGLYSGYHDAGVGKGENFNINSRGTYPEWYLFRLPTTDCYLTKDHNTQIPTFGPKLTDEEIKYLDIKLQKQKYTYRKLFGKYPVSLVKMKKLYDIAICVEPYVEDAEDLSQNELRDERYRASCRAVDCLVKM